MSAQLAATEDALARQHLPLACAAARRFASRNPVRFDDAYSDAQLGLLRGLRSYQPEHAASLKTWLRHKMRSAMLDGVRERDRLSRWFRKEVKQGRMQAVQYVSGQTAMRDRDGTFLYLEDTFASRDEPVGKEVEDRDEVADVLRFVPHRSAVVLWMVLALEFPHRSVGVGLRVSLSRVSHMVADGVEALQKRTGRESP